MRNAYRFHVGQLVAAKRDLHTRFGPVYPAGTIFKITRRFGGYTAQEFGGERRWIRKASESAFRALTEEERVAYGE